MKIVLLDRNSFPDWAGFLPEEIFVELMSGKQHMHAVGMMFLREAQGAIVWEEKGGEWVLRSIYIAPISRRLGLGSELVSYLAEQMQDKGCRHLSVSYDDQGERMTLTPFLRRCGFVMESYDFSVGVTTVEEIVTSMHKFDAFKRSGDCRALSLLPQREKKLCDDWLAEQIGENIDRYLIECPESFALIKDNKVKGIMLFDEKDGVVSLDYCWISQETVNGFLVLAAASADSLRKHYSGNTEIEVILSTVQAEKLYSHLLNERRKHITICRGSFLPLWEEIVEE